MSVTYGFYNSLDGDRKYSAEDISRVFDGLITDGIFKAIGDAFAVSASGEDRQVCVGTGRAWFNRTWTYNDTPLYLDIDSAVGGALNRIDIVVIDIDIANRTNSIKVVKGESTSETAVPPTLTNGENGTSYQYPLCRVVISSKEVIEQQDIINCRGNADLGTQFVTALLESVSVDDLVAQWEDSFEKWFESVKGVLDGDTAGNLTNRLLALEGFVDDKKGDGDRWDVVSKRRNFFRGKNLGTDISTEQLRTIRDGQFDDIYVGDYWEIENKDAGVTYKWRVVDIDYWKRPTGETRHHVLLMPDEPIGTLAANETATTEGGYVNSELAAAVNGEFFIDTSEFFGWSALVNRLTHEEYLVSSVDATNGRPISGAWFDVKELVPSEVMMFGTRIWSYGNSGNVDSTGGTTDHLFTNSPTQLAAFRLCPELIFCNSRYWLSDVVSLTQFAMVLEGNGTVNRAKASSSYGYRPIVMIG